MMKSQTLVFIAVPLLLSLDDPSPSSPTSVAVRIDCDDEKVALESTVKPEKGKLALPSGTAPTNAAFLGDIRSDYERDYYCASCAGVGCDLGSDQSMGTFTFQLVDANHLFDYYEWESSDIRIVIDCSPCD